MRAARSAADTLAVLPAALRHARWERRLTLREAAEQMNLAISTLHRVEMGQEARTQTLITMLNWLAQGDPNDD